MRDIDTLRISLEYAARFSLAIVFLVAGLSKLMRPHSPAVAAVHLRVIKSPTLLFGLSLAGAELLTTTLLLAPMTVLIGSLCAGVLSLSFVVFSISALMRGERFICGCIFGQARLSWLTPIRACVMCVAAVLAGIGWVTRSPAMVVGESVVVITSVFVVLALGVPWTVGALRKRWSRAMAPEDGAI